MGSQGVLLGGIIMTQKTIAAIGIAGLVTLAIGIGIGRTTARMGPEEAKARFGLVEEEKYRGLEGRLSRAAAQLESLKAEHSRRAGEKKAMAAKVDVLESQIRAEKERAEQAATSEKTSKKVPVSFGVTVHRPTRLW